MGRRRRTGIAVDGDVEGNLDVPRAVRGPIAHGVSPIGCDIDRGCIRLPGTAVDEVVGRRHATEVVRGGQRHGYIRGEPTVATLRPRQGGNRDWRSAVDGDRRGRATCKARGGTYLELDDVRPGRGVCVL